MCLPGTAEVVRKRFEVEGAPRVDRRTALIGAAGAASGGELPGRRARRTAAAGAKAASAT